MPRRTRPASRPPPRRTRPSTAQSPQLNAKPSSKKVTTEKSQKSPEKTHKANEVIQNSPDLSSEDDSEEQDEDLEGESQSSSSEDEAENDMEDADAPRAVQWVDDEWEDAPGPSKPVCSF